VPTNGYAFQADFGLAGTITYNDVEQDQPNDESPGLSASRLVDGEVFHTCSTSARGLEAFNRTYALLDMTSKGRDEGDLPWSMAWLRRKDQYDD